jgi:hypothetical protein
MHLMSQTSLFFVMLRLIYLNLLPDLKTVGEPLLHTTVIHYH